MLGAVGVGLQNLPSQFPGSRAPFNSVQWGIPPWKDDDPDIIWVTAGSSVFWVQPEGS